MSHAFIVPLRDFEDAKSRLRRAGLDAAAIARDLAIGVIEACRPQMTFVVTESASIVEFSTSLGVEALFSQVSSLDAALDFARERLRAEFNRITIVHGDLDRPTGLALYNFDTPTTDVVLFTDRLGSGTNVLSLPSNVDFRFCYGVDSAPAHEREAARLGLSVRVVRESPWNHDVDEPKDLRS